MKLKQVIKEMKELNLGDNEIAVAVSEQGTMVVKEGAEIETTTLMHMVFDLNPLSLSKPQKMVFEEVPQIINFLTEEAEQSRLQEDFTLNTIRVNKIGGYTFWADGITLSADSLEECLQFTTIIRDLSEFKERVDDFQEYTIFVDNDKFYGCYAELHDYLTNEELSEVLKMYSDKDIATIGI